MGFLIVLVMAAVVPGVLKSDNSGPPEKITVCFRCDDFFASEGRPSGRLYETKKGIIGIFRGNRIPLTIGVVPNVHNSLSGYGIPYRRLTASDPVAALLREVRDDPLFEIALHGLTHAPNAYSKVSEWIGLSAATQTAGIEKGKRMLLDAMGYYDLKTFIPPWNSFDLNTLRALKANGLENLSGDTGIVRNKPFAARNRDERKYFGVRMIPATCGLAELDEAIKLAEAGPSAQIIVVVFHPYDFREYRRGGTPVSFDLAGLDVLLKRIRQDDRLRFLRLRDIGGNAVSASRYTAACRYCMVLRALKVFLPGDALHYAGFIDEGTGHWLDKGRYLTEEEYSRLFTRALVLLILSGASAGVAAGVLVQIIMRKRTDTKRIAVFVFMLFTLFVLGLLFMELRSEILSAPGMIGLLAAYCTFFVSLSLTAFILMAINDHMNDKRRTIS